MHGDYFIVEDFVSVLKRVRSCLWIAKGDGDRWLDGISPRELEGIFSSTWSRPDADVESQIAYWVSTECLEGDDGANADTELQSLPRITDALSRPLALIILAWNGLQRNLNERGIQTRRIGRSALALTIPGSLYPGVRRGSMYPKGEYIDWVSKLESILGSRGCIEIAENTSSGLRLVAS